MLQQTQVERVIPKYHSFLAQFPQWQDLAGSPLNQVLLAWQGLGYNRRAQALHRAAHHVVHEWRGKLSEDVALLQTLPGVGPYTARAIATFAFNQPHVLLETNIRAVFIHEFFSDRRLVRDDQLIPLITNTIDVKKPRKWYWALMDYGSHLKKHTNNPSRRSAHYARQTAFLPSNRRVRGLILKQLSTTGTVPFTTLANAIGTVPVIKIEQALAGLLKEGLVSKRRGRLHLGS